MNRIENGQSHENLIGKSPWRVIGEIWRQNPQIESFYFCAIDPKHYRKRSSKDPQFHDPTLAYGELSKSTPLGVLDSTLVGRRIFLELLLEGGALSLIRNNLEIKKVLDRLSLTIKDVEGLVQKEREQFIFGLLSAVKLENGTFRHIPMIDFSSSGVGQDLSKARKALKTIEQRRGFILSTGRGLHYYGIKLLSEELWPKFVGRCLLLNLYDVRIIDHRYIGHRLIDGVGCLRIAPHPVKPTTPKIVEVFENLDAPASSETAEDDFLTGEKKWETLRRSGEPLFRF